MIVSRGLGLGGYGAVVTAGMAIAVSLIVIPPLPEPDPLPTYNRRGNPGVMVVRPVTRPASVTIHIPAPKAEQLVRDVAAKGAGYAELYIPTPEGYIPAVHAYGSAATSIVIGVRADTKLGTMIAKGEHDVSDEELLSMVMALLDL